MVNSEPLKMAWINLRKTAISTSQLPEGTIQVDEDALSKFNQSLKAFLRELDE